MSDRKPITVGRYLLHRRIARGGMATIHIARLLGDVGFSRIVAAKRMRPELAEDKEFVSMFLDEARIASKVQHRNVVPVLDVVTMGEELVLVQEYVHGAPLSVLLRTSSAANAHVPIPVAAAIACQVLAGLHAAHEAVDETGMPLHIVHRDVSPQNIMIATDGSARLLDFGVAKASVAAHVTRAGEFKGKLGYAAPEQIRGEANKQSDIYSLGVVLWELLVGHRLHANTHGETHQIAGIMSGNLPSITESLADEKSWIGGYRWSQLEALEPIIRKALDVNYRRRWQTAADMEEAIAAAVPLAPASDVAAWLRAVGKDFLDAREALIAEEEASWRRTAASTAQAQRSTATRRRVPAAPKTLEHPVGIASEPDDAPVLPPAPLRRSPTAIIVALVIALAAAVALLLRDLDSAKTASAPAPSALTTEPSPAPAPATTVIAPPTRATVAPAPSVSPPPPVPAEIRATSPTEVRDEREERLRDEDPVEHQQSRARSVSPKKKSTSRASTR